MSDIILPGNLDTKGASGAQLAAASVALEKRQEAEQLDVEIKGRLNFYAPYHDDAPVCDAAITQGAEPIPTRFHEVIQLPAWSYGQCIGPACVRFMLGLNVCGRKVQDYAAAVALGLTTQESVRDLLKRAALPPKESSDG